MIDRAILLLIWPAIENLAPSPHGKRCDDEQNRFDLNSLNAVCDELLSFEGTQVFQSCRHIKNVRVTMMSVDALFPEYAHELIQADLQLINSLAKAAANIDKFSSSAGRQLLTEIFVGLRECMRVRKPERGDISCVFDVILNEFADLDRGISSQLFQPAEITNRPPAKMNEGILRANAAAVLHFRILSGMNSKQAGALVARAVCQLGYRDRAGAKPNTRQVQRWRDDLRQRRVKNKQADERFCLLLKYFESVDPSAAADEIIAMMPQISYGRIPAKPTS